MMKSTNPHPPPSSVPRRRLGAALLLSAIACGPARSAAPAGVTIADPWLRMLTPAVPAGGYFELRNDSADAVELVGAASPDCATLSLHRSSEQNGMSSMHEVGPIAVPAGGTLLFAPGGYHLMCMRPSPAIKPGGRIPVTLRFDRGRGLDILFAVRGARGP